MRMGAPRGLTDLLKDGYKVTSGLEEAIMRNVEACKGMSAITRTSLGPNGMNKLVINHLERLFVTSDAATIVEELEVAHPAARMVCRAAKTQVEEVGDGSNLVISFAGELLSQAEGLLRLGVHPTDIVEGYKRATIKTLELLDAQTVTTLSDPRDKAALTRALTPVVAAKQLGYEELLAGLVAEACLTVMPAAPKKASVAVDNVRVAKLIGGTISDSQIVKGVVVQRDTEGSVKHVEKAKIAVFGCSIESSSAETKGVVVIKNADELMSYNKGEEKLMDDNIRAIAETGVKVVVAGGSISEIAMHFIEKYGMMAVKVLSKFELRRLCKAVNATALVRVGAPMVDELGFADAVSVQELSSRLVTVFRQDNDESSIATIVLRGATMNLLDDMERAIDDAANVAKVLCKDGRMVAGAGAVETELAYQIGLYGAAMPGLEQYAINKYAEALEVVPRTLAENSGQNATDVISALYAAHAAGKTTVGVDIDGGLTKDAAAAGICDSTVVKASALRLASDTAITILRVDQIIMSKQAGGPKPKAPGPADPDD
jgi:T-complex protein 1 subunit theta